LLLVFSWRATFLVSALFGSIGVVLMYFTIPETLKSKPSGRPLDRLGIGFRSFIRERDSIFGAILVGLTFSALISVVTLSSEIFVKTFGFSELKYAICFSIASMGYVGGGLINRFFLRRFDEKRLIIPVAFGFGVFAIGLFINHVFFANQFQFLIVLIIWLFSCISAALALATTIALKPLAETAGMGAAILGTVQLAFGGMCSAMLTVVNFESVGLLHFVLGVISVGIVCLIYIEARMQKRN
jgi:DHA1 family bicyclomycin/chloramphenicol resistance-like MFS transporter